MTYFTVNINAAKLTIMMQLANAFPKNPAPLFPTAKLDLNEFPSSVILPLTLFNGSDCWLFNFSLISFNNQIKSLLY